MPAQYKKIETVNEFIDAVRLRIDVFIKEQGFKVGWEPDEDDKKSEHFIALIDGEVVSTARCRESSPGEIKIERMATRKECRGKGIGAGLLDYMLSYIKKKNPKKIWLRSQVRSKGFYEKNGFKTVSEPFEMYGVAHIDMQPDKGSVK